MLPRFALENDLITRVIDGWDDLNWYAEAKQWASIIAGRYGLSTKQVAGIIAALSPQRKWAINLRQTVEFITAHGDVYLHYGNQVHKAQAILAGADPDAELTGPKENCFYHNIMGETDKVTVDRHMLNVLRIDGRLTPKRYEFAYDTISRVADALHVTVPQAQACIWSTMAKDIT